MFNLSTLAEILKTEGNLTVTETEDGLLISDVNEEKNVPADLISFVGIYEKNTNITPKGDGYVIKTETFSGQTFMMLLASVYGAEYTFKVTGDYEVTATKRAKEDVKADVVKEEVIEVDFVKLAEAIDSEDIEIEIHEDGLKITGLNKTAIAEQIDSLNPKLNIEITNESVLVSEGE